MSPAKSEIQPALNLMFADAIRANWERTALADYKGAQYTYRQVARQIARIHILYSRHDVAPGDKVALCGRNCAHWAMAFLSSMTYGTVTVPLLNDFMPESIMTLAAHSEARILFVDKAIWAKLDIARMPMLETVIAIDDFTLLYSTDKTLTGDLAELDRLYAEQYPEGVTPSSIQYYDADPDALALINYTSGSTGVSKGVMLPYRSIHSNLQFAWDHMPYLHAGDGIVSMLPMAHMYGLAIEFLFPFTKGAAVTFLGKLPSPTLLLGAFSSVRPKLIITVPLVIEKIIKGRIFPRLRKPLMRVLLHIPVINNIIYSSIREKLLAVFGGKLYELIIGGAALNKDVERFMRRIHFPFTVGFGMTECGPLIAYAPWDKTAPGACGRIVDRMEGRIDSPDPQHTPGVLYVKGDNVMLGYYKNPEATADALGDDGWLCTGDICTVDPSGLLTIRGRDKNMILGPSGQNIYPEEIETVLNGLPYVVESVVVDRDHRLVALIYPDREGASDNGLNADALRRQMDENIAEVNRAVPAYSRVASYELRDEPFEKTPKQSIRRFLYK